MKWKIKIKGASSGMLKRRAFLTHPHRNPIEVGEVYVDGRSGWQGGGQRWSFWPIENPIALSLVKPHRATTTGWSKATTGWTKKELLSQLHDMLEVSDNEIIRKHA